jgi:hypothetical protein
MLSLRETCLALSVALVLQGCSGLPAAEESPKVEGAPSPAEGPQDPKATVRERLRDLPAGQLPTSTRARPDPARDQFAREPISVEIDETIEAQGQAPRAADVRVTGNYLKAYLQRAGFPIVLSSDRPPFSITGTVRVGFHDEIRALDRVVGWRYRAAGSIVIFDREGKELAKIDIPEFLQENARSEVSAALQVRRYLSKLLWDDLFARRNVLGRSDVPRRLDALSVEPGTTEFEEAGDPQTPDTVEDVVRSVADAGLGAVPYLLEYLSDERTVRLPTKIAALQSSDPERVKVFHVADKILEEIFQKVSRLPLGCTREERFTVTAGWEGEWARFCPSFRALRAAEAELRARRAKATTR